MWSDICECKCRTLFIYGDVQLEIDDEGKPYYIRSYGEFITARNGFDVKGIVMVDPETGDVKKYAISDVPAFINGAVSPEAVSLQNSYFGNYIHGFWNSVVGKKDVKLPSDEGTEANVSPIFDENGHMYYFTDFTSPKEGVDSMLGYALTDGRTGKRHITRVTWKNRIWIHKGHFKSLKRNSLRKNGLVKCRYSIIFTGKQVG